MNTYEATSIKIPIDHIYKDVMEIREKNTDRVIWAKKFNVNAIETTGGTTTGSGLYRYKSNATVTAIPDTGYSFLKWTDGTTEISSNPYSFQIGNKDVELSANFTASHLVGGRWIGTGWHSGGAIASWKPEYQKWYGSSSSGYYHLEISISCDNTTNQYRCHALIEGDYGAWSSGTTYVDYGTITEGSTVGVKVTGSAGGPTITLTYYS